MYTVGTLIYLDFCSVSLKICDILGPIHISTQCLEYVIIYHLFIEAIIINYVFFINQNITTTRDYMLV